MLRHPEPVCKLSALMSRRGYVYKNVRMSADGSMAAYWIACNQLMNRAMVGS
jgi:hypothetical protein